MRVLLSTRELDVDVRVAARVDRHIRNAAVPQLLSEQAGKLSQRQAAEYIAARRIASRFGKDHIEQAFPAHRCALYRRPARRGRFEDCT